MQSMLNIYQILDQWLVSINQWYIWHTVFNYIGIDNLDNIELFYTNLIVHENWFTGNFFTAIGIFINDTYVFDLFNYSIPNIKLYYPEPFIATPSYIHDDIWFIHIVIYQYWLWFFFISLIIFFFISYLIAIRWNNIRLRPSRETRGVSRSKCGDLITAVVPVSWASSIIIHESTDAIEFYDGFGSTEMAVGIRAYQWGWEYYYPRNMDLLNWNNVKTSYIGKSLMYPNNNYDSLNQNIFKNYNYLSNINQNNTISLFLWSNWNTNNKQLLSNTTFGTNKLLNNSITLLITTPKIYNINMYLIPNTNIITSNSFLNLYQIYKRFIFNNIHTAQTCIVWNQLFLTNTLVLYNTLIDSTINYNINLLWNYMNSINTEWFVWNNWFNVLNSSFLIKNINFEFNNTISDNINQSSKFNYELMLKNHLNWNSSFFFNFFAEQDFKQWINHDLLEDIVWDMFFIHKYFYKTLNNFMLINDNKNYINFHQLQKINQSENIFFNDFSVYENVYTLPFINYSIWQLDFYNKHQLLNLNWMLWVLESLNNSFTKFKWNQYLIWLLNNNYLLFILTNIKFLSIYELLYFYYTSNFTYWIASNSSNSLITNNYKQLIYNLSTNWNLNSKLFNTSNNSFWKIFKLSFQDEKNLFNFKLFSNSFITLPYNTNQLLLLNTIQKNSLLFVSSLVFKNYLYINKNYLYNIDFIWFNSINTFPFLTSVESDIIRYIWFDWYTVRNCIITKSIDTSLYNLHGTLNYNYNFTKQPLLTLINKTDNFFIKYMHARKLYLPLYIYSPFYYTTMFKGTNWKNLLFNFTNSFNYWKLQYSFLMLSLWIDNNFITMNYWFNFNNNLSFITAHTHGFNLITSFLNTIDQLTQLNDILVKRNYLLLYLNFQLNNYYLPITYQLTMQNPLLQLFKYTTNRLNFSLKFYYKNLNQSVQSILQSYIQNYKNLNIDIKNQLNDYTLSNPYQPLRKGITNMIRIHADKAVAMPIDTRLQLLAVSRDIIHSWAIPSAGIKIDCIPGYSSHRVAIFLLSGIYWGQCMEICGRFHHWMPIVVYFIRRDLFCIWCIHFIFVNKQLNMVNQSFELYNNYSTSFTSISMNYWLYELTV